MQAQACKRCTLCDPVSTALAGDSHQEMSESVVEFANVRQHAIPQACSAVGQRSIQEIAGAITAWRLAPGIERHVGA